MSLREGALGASFEGTSPIPPKGPTSYTSTYAYTYTSLGDTHSAHGVQD